MLHRTQFASVYAVPPDLLNMLLASGWQDVSYGNDVCPSFVNGMHRLWVDAEDITERETQGDRFVMTFEDDGAFSVLWSTNSIDAAMNFLASH